MSGYFIDTSVWIDYFRNHDAGVNDRIDSWIDENRIHINGIVLAELLSGARSQREYDILLATLTGLNFLEGDRRSSDAVGFNGFVLKRKGVSVPLSDLIIASDCILHDLVLVDRDSHFKTIARHLKLKRFA